MAEREYSAAIRAAARKLYQFVLARELEQIPTTTADIEAHLAALGVAGQDTYDVYSLAITEADFRKDDVPPGTNVDYAWDYECHILSTQSNIEDACLDWMDRESAAQGEWLRRVSAE